MKILLVSVSGYGAWFTLRLEDEGHDVDYYLLNKKYKNILRGIAPEPFFEKPNLAHYDLILFDQTGKSKLAEEAVAVTPTIGDGDFQSELEDNRAFGIEIMEQVGINVPFYQEFDNIAEAKRFIKRTNKRYVFKPDTEGTEQDTASTYISNGPDDLLHYLDKLGHLANGASFILQEVVSGTEVSTEAYFNGTEFFLINGTLEEKKFMNDKKGPNTGCSGNLVWIYERPPKIFYEGLGRLKDFLTEYKYKGMIDLNTIVSDTKVYGLEWTPRFGYDASATLFNLITSPLADFLGEIAYGQTPEYTFEHRFASSIRLSIPPYPSETPGFFKDNVPVEGICPEDIVKNCYLYDVMTHKEDLVSAGCSGLIACPITSGGSLKEAFSKLNDKIKCIKIPDMQMRTDIEKCVEERYALLEAQGWLR